MWELWGLDFAEEATRREEEHLNEIDEALTDLEKEMLRQLEQELGKES